MSWMLRLYPRGWRRRYGAEVAELIARERPSFRLFLDLLAGAIDARLDPQEAPAAAAAEGDDPMSSIRRLCARSGVSRGERQRSAAWMIGASLGFVAIALWLELALDRTVLSQAFLFGAFPMALILSGRSTYLQGYSRPARWILQGGGLVGMFLFMLAVTWFANSF